MSTWHGDGSHVISAPSAADCQVIRYGEGMGIWFDSGLGHIAIMI
jgi:hypothetical protein